MSDKNDMYEEELVDGLIRMVTSLGLIYTAGVVIKYLWC